MKLGIVISIYLISSQSAFAQRCDDADQRKFISTVVNEITEARKDQTLKGKPSGSSGGFPAMDPNDRYENRGANVEASVTRRTQQTAQRIYESMKAAVNKDGNLGSLSTNAAESFLGGATRRSNFSMRVRCGKSDELTEGMSGGRIHRCGGAPPVDMSVSSRMVMSSRLSAAELADKASGKLVNFSNAKTEISSCDKDCNVDGKGYSDPKVNFMDFKPHQFKVRVPMETFIGDFSMTNYIRAKVIKVSVCGFESYLMTNVVSHNIAGFDRGAVIGLVSQIGTQSLLLADGELQLGPGFGLEHRYKLPTTAYEKDNNRHVPDVYRLAQSLYNDIGNEVSATEAIADGVVIKPDTSVALVTTKGEPPKPSIQPPAPGDRDSFDATPIISQ